MQLSPALNRAIENTPKKKHSGYLLQWFDAHVSSTDPLSHQPVLDIPPTDKPDVHTPASVFLGDMMVSDVTVRLKAAGFDVKTQVCSAQILRQGFIKEPRRCLILRSYVHAYITW